MKKIQKGVRREVLRDIFGKEGADQLFHKPPADRGDKRYSKQVGELLAKDSKETTLKIDLVGLSKEKTSPSNIEKKFEINRIPTIIFIKKNSELNRIVEYPIESMEKDILKILKNKKYFNAYHIE